MLVIYVSETSNTFCYTFCSEKRLLLRARNALVGIGREGGFLPEGLPAVS